MLSNIDIMNSRLVPLQVLLLALCAFSPAGVLARVVSYNGLGLLGGEDIPEQWGS